MYTKRGKQSFRPQKSLDPRKGAVKKVQTLTKRVSKSIDHPNTNYIHMLHAQITTKFKNAVCYAQRGWGPKSVDAPTDKFSRPPTTIFMNSP